jgi:hypothetical protein
MESWTAIKIYVILATREQTTLLCVDSLLVPASVHSVLVDYLTSLNERKIVVGQTLIRAGNLDVLI